MSDFVIETLYISKKMLFLDFWYGIYKKN